MGSDCLCLELLSQDRGVQGQQPELLLSAVAFRYSYLDSNCESS